MDCPGQPLWLGSWHWDLLFSFNWRVSPLRSQQLHNSRGDSNFFILDCERICLGTLQTWHFRAAITCDNHGEAFNSKFTSRLRSRASAVLTKSVICFECNWDSSWGCDCIWCIHCNFTNTSEGLTSPLLPSASVRREVIGFSRQMVSAFFDVDVFAM